MLGSNIFYSGYNTLFGILSLFIGLGSVFLVRGSKDFRSLLIFQIGGLFLFLITYLATNEHVLYKFGLNYHFVAFIIMILSLLTSVLWIDSAAELYSNRLANHEILAIYTTVCLTAGLYYCFIDYNQAIANSLSAQLTLIGLSFVLLSSTLRCVAAPHIGHILLFISIIILWGKLLVSTFFFHYNWLNLNIFNWLWIYLFSAAMIATKIADLRTDLQKSWNQIDILHQQISNMIDSSPFPILIAKITGDRILLINEKACNLFGISKKESNYFKLKDFLVDEENRGKLFSLLEKKHEVQDFDLMVCNIINASPFWLSVSAKAIEYNNEMALYMAFQDITLRKERENNLRNQADKDPLTLSWNRRYFEKLVPERIKESIKQSQNFSLLMIDADNFKNINDTYGHKSGDKVLIELAACCRKSLREEDIVCRFGGEEFVIYLHNTNTQSAHLVAERLRRIIADTSVESDDGRHIKFTVSIGLVSSEETDSLEVLLRQVDDAMYLAKNNGRNRTEIYNAEAVKKIMGKKQISTKRNLHPIFHNEEAEEISLLDNYENKTL